MLTTRKKCLLQGGGNKVMLSDFSGPLFNFGVPIKAPSARKILGKAYDEARKLCV